MSYSKLYQAVQNQPVPVSTKWLKEQAIQLSAINRVKEQWSSVVDPNHMRGFYIEGPLGPPVPLAEHESLIVLSRAMCTGHHGDYWRRLVYTKELMHVFDEEDEKASDEASFDLQIQKFGNPKLDASPQFKAESKAFWRALCALCPEAKRTELKSQLAAGSISYDVVSATLRIPVGYCRELMRPDFEAIRDAVK
jgi:hypothetical protein